MDPLELERTEHDRKKRLAAWAECRKAMDGENTSEVPVVNATGRMGSVSVQHNPASSNTSSKTGEVFEKVQKKSKKG